MKKIIQNKICIHYGFSFIFCSTLLTFRVVSIMKLLQTSVKKAVIIYCPEDTYNQKKLFHWRIQI